MGSKPRQYSSLWEKEQEKRVLSDIVQFNANIVQVKKTAQNSHALSLARKYCEDTKYFLQKKDYVTAFGAINYAHGLLDAFRLKK
ncbi:DUF357 domain-containing protein [Candidatus Micrarchaeota archaeon]|nr:DUF357 domain-containing protein [Candidatus Micrarchaeota archaeon]